MKNLRFAATCAAASAVFAMGCLDTLYAQGTTPGLVASTANLIIAIPSGASSAQQNVSITNTTNSTVAVSATSNNPVFTIQPTTVPIAGGATGQFTVTATSTGTGTITFTDTLGFAGSANVSVTACVQGSSSCSASGGTSTLTAAPNPLNFAIPASSSTPVTQSLSLQNTSTAATSVTAMPGANWLTINPGSVQTLQPAGSQNSSVTYAITVSPSLLPAGASTASSIIIFTPPSGSAIIVPVNVTVGAAPTLTVTPSKLSFAYQTGTPFSGLQTSLSLTSDTPAQFTVTATTASGGQWLVVSPASGATNGGNGAATLISVQVNPSGLTANTYTGTITITNTASGTQIMVPVTLLVSNLPVISFVNNGTPSSGTTINYQFNSSTQPSPQTVQVVSSGNPLSFTVAVNPVSGGNFLTVNPLMGTTPQTLSLTLNSSVVSTLAPGTYVDNVVVTAAGAGNSSVTYPVTLVVTNTTLLSPSQSSLVFNYQLNTTALPVSQTITVNSSGAPLTFSVSTTNTTPVSGNNTQPCGNFLSATTASGAMSTTPATVIVSVNTANLAAGTCTGTVNIGAAGAGNSPLAIPVTLYVSNTALLNASPSAINVSTQVGTNPASQTIALTSTDPANQIAFTVTSSTNTGTGWLLVGPTAGTTPQNLTIGFNAAGLAVGTYTGNITVTATAAGVADSPVTIPVMLIVTSSTTASTSAASLSFSQPFGGQPPAFQMLSINSSSPGLTFGAVATTLTGGNWLSLSGSPSGTTPGTINVDANGANLSTGTYTGYITITIPGASNSPINVPVTLTIGQAASLSVTTSSVTFNYQAGSVTAPQSQTVQVTSSGGAVNFTASATNPSNAPNLFTVTPASGTTPGTLTIGVNSSALTNLTMGTYTGTVTVSSSAGSQTITVNLVVSAAAAPAITAVVNAASGFAGPIAPGEIVSIFGTNIGPATAAGLTLTSSGTVATTLSNTSVTFNGVAAPLIYVSATQINAVVPYEIANQVSVPVVVSRNGTTSTAVQLRVSNTSPGIFSLSQNGNGQGAILNQNSTVNGSSNPAAKGSVIQIFGTGEGVPSPAPATGSVTSTTGTFPTFGNVSVTIGGQPAQVVYSGEAPGFVSGVFQINAVVPSTTASGAQPVVITIGGNTNSSQTITTIIQ